MAAPIRSAAPVSRQNAGLINGHHTDVVCTPYENQTFIIATQFQKLGTLVHVSQDSVLDVGSGPASYSIKVLLGKDEPFTRVIARNIIEKVPSQKPLLLALALRDSSPETMRSVTELILQNELWSQLPRPPPPPPAL